MTDGFPMVLGIDSAGRILELRPPAVHKQLGAGDEAAVVGSEEQDRACDSGRIRQPPKGVVAFTN